MRRGRPFWDPFCGGLSMSAAFCKAGGRGIVSDANPSLIALYQAVAAGWDPPTHVSEDDYRVARSLPDTDPLKAFAGFGCSFGGKWFGGYARQPSTGRNYAMNARNVVLRDVGAIVRSGSIIACADFLAFEPRPIAAVLYLDPPYEGTTGYGAVAPFDHARFYARVAAWANYTDVFVSEYGMPWGRLAAEMHPFQSLAGRCKETCKKPERLYRYGPDRYLDQVMM